MSMNNIYANKQKLFSEMTDHLRKGLFPKGDLLVFWKVFLGKRKSSQAKSY